MNAMIATGDGFKVNLTAHANVLKDHCLIRANNIEIVEDKDSQERAVILMKEIKGLLNKCESSRKEVKEPALEFGKRVDQIAKDYVKELKEKYDALAEMVASYQEAQQQQVLENIKSGEEPAEIIKEDGQITKKVAEWEIIDLSAFYLVHPDLCDIIPNKSKINEAIKSGIIKDISYIKVNWVTKASVRV